MAFDRLPQQIESQIRNDLLFAIMNQNRQKEERPSSWGVPMKPRMTTQNRTHEVYRERPGRRCQFHFPEFLAISREKYATPAVAGCPPATLTKGSAELIRRVAKTDNTSVDSGIPKGSNDPIMTLM